MLLNLFFDIIINIFVHMFTSRIEFILLRIKILNRMPKNRKTVYCAALRVAQMRRTRKTSFCLSDRSNFCAVNCSY